MSKNKFYVLTMYRWGDREKHSYVLGVFTNSEKAEKEKEQAEEDRGGKYVGEIREFIPDNPDLGKVIGEKIVSKV